MTFPPMPLLPITSPATIEKCRTLPLRPSDVFICSYPKSGTTWTQMIVLSLILADRRHRPQAEVDADDQRQGDGEDIDFDHVSDYAPFYEIDAHWDANSNRLAESVRKNHDKLNQRVFNTHLRWEMLPKKSEDGNSGQQQNRVSNQRTELQPQCGKFIYVTRNLQDVCTSFYHHLSNQKEGTYTEGFESFVRDWIDGNIPFGSPLHHLISFAKGFSDNVYFGKEEDTINKVESSHQEGNKGDDDDNTKKAENRTNLQQKQQDQPLLLLSYERMKDNLRDEVLRIMDFLNLNNIPMEVLDTELLPSFTFTSMKSNANRFQPKSVTWLNEYQFLRKGESGDGKQMFMSTFTATDNEKEGVPLLELFRDWVTRVQKLMI